MVGHQLIRHQVRHRTSSPCVRSGPDVWQGRCVRLEKVHQRGNHICTRRELSAQVVHSKKTCTTCGDERKICFRPDSWHHTLCCEYVTTRTYSNLVIIESEARPVVLLLIGMAVIPTTRSLFTPARSALGHFRTLATVADPAPPPPARFGDGSVRHDWRRSEIQRVFDAPLMETVYRAVSCPDPLRPLQLMKNRRRCTGCITTHPAYSSVLL